jgi:hypothetical protein
LSLCVFKVRLSGAVRAAVDCMPAEITRVLNHLAINCFMDTGALTLSYLL